MSLNIIFLILALSCLAGIAILCLAEIRITQKVTTPWQEYMKRRRKEDVLESKRAAKRSAAMAKRDYRAQKYLEKEMGKL